MNSGSRPWAVPTLFPIEIQRKRTHILVGIVTLALVLLVGFVSFAKTVTVEVDGKSIKYITVRTTVGDFLSHTKLNVFPEDLVLPGRDTAIKRGLDITLVRSTPITINLDGKEISYRTLSPKVGIALEGAGRKLGFRLKDSDEVEPERQQDVTENQVISVRRSIPLTIVADGKSKQREMAPRPVREVLQREKIELGSKDRVSPGLDEIITANTTIKVVRVTEKVLTVQGKLNYQTVAKQGDFPLGLPDRVISKGVIGLEERSEKVTYEDGAEVDRIIVSQRTLQKPVDQVVARGAQTTVTRGGATIKFKRAMLVQATAYSEPGATTALGVPVDRGVVAVDPGVIPYYSRMYIEGYGWGTALDTGGAIRGNRIDLYMNSLQEALSWGRRSIIIYIQ
ncbi:MAG TPA: ubiquitin-like domain-containing protein [Verrucomicrobiae bacterium]|nr:ubiquitin-like domain-containing protein [Verrucomicrobiae bacterium]